MKRHISKLTLGFFALVLLALASTTARADIVISSGADIRGTEAVDLAGGMGNPVFGDLRPSLVPVRFSSNENLTASAASITAVDGTLTQLTIDVPTRTFTQVVLNINAATDGTVNFVVTEDNGQQNAGSFSLNGKGQNFFTIYAVNGQRISSVAFTTDVNMSITQVEEVRQVRIGGVQ